MINTKISIKSVTLATIRQSKVCIFRIVGWNLVMLASVVHEVVKYYRRPKRSTNKIQILETKFKFEKKIFIGAVSTKRLL